MVTLYLDLDGTLIDVRRRHYAVYADSARQLGLDPLPEAVSWTRRRAGAAAADLIDRALRARFSRLWRERIEARDYLALDTTVPAAREALMALRAEHQLVLVTLRHDRGALESQLRRLDLDHQFSAVYSPTGASTTKAELIRPYLALPALLVGDSEADVDAARELKVPVACVATGLRGNSYLLALAPDYLIETVSDLSALLERSVVSPAQPTNV